MLPLAEESTSWLTEAIKIGGTSIAGMAGIAYLVPKVWPSIKELLAFIKDWIFQTKEHREKLREQNEAKEDKAKQVEDDRVEKRRIEALQAQAEKDKKQEREDRRNQTQEAVDRRQFVTHLEDAVKRLEQQNVILFDLFRKSEEKSQKEAVDCAAKILELVKGQIGFVRSLAESDGKIHVLEMELASLRGFNDAANVPTAMHAIIIANQSGTVLVWNQAATLMFGWDEAEMVGASVERIISPEHLAQHRASLTDMIERRRPVTALAIRGNALHEDGRKIPVEISLSSAMKSDGSRRIQASIRQRPVGIDGIEGEDEESFDISKQADADVGKAIKEQLARSSGVKKPPAQTTSVDLAGNGGQL